MTAVLLDGKKTAKDILDSIQQTVALSRKQGLRAPGLAVIQVGHDSASTVYVTNKRQCCKQVGIRSFSYDLASTTSPDELLTLITTLNSNDDVDGILVQLPLPSHINAQTIIEAIAVDKDVDGFHPFNVGRLVQKLPGLRPCTPLGVMTLLKKYKINVMGLNATVVGVSTIVGRPMGLELLVAGATVSYCHSETRSLKEHITKADLVVVATGKKDIVKPDWFKKDAVVIDVGIHRLSNGSLRGDLDFKQCQKKVAYLTPVPGGIGPMTVASLLTNTLIAYQQHTTTNKA